MKLFTLPTPPADMWFVAGLGNSDLDASRNVVDNEVFYYPFRVTRRVSVDKTGLVARPHNGPVNGTAVVGVYSHDASAFRPSSKLAEATINLDDVDLAWLPQEAALSSTVVLQSRTIYWIGVGYRQDDATGGHSIRHGTVSTISGGTESNIVWGTDVPGDTIRQGSFGWTHVENTLTEGWTNLPDPYDATGETAVKSGAVPRALLHITADSSDLYGPGYGPPFHTFTPPVGEDQFMWLGFSRGTLTFGAGAVRDPSERALDGRLLYWPLTPPHDIKLTEIGVEVQDADSGGIAAVNAGIYSDSGGLPDTLLVEMGVKDTSTTGEKKTTIDMTLSGETRYWVAFVYKGPPDATIGFRGFASDFLGTSIADLPIGSPDINEMGGDVGGGGQQKLAPTHLEISGRADASLPDPAVTAGIVRTSGRDGAANQEGGAPGVFVKWTIP